MGATTTETRTGPVAGARAGLDVLLTDAAVGNGTRRFIPPRAVAQVAVGVAKGDRRFADPAWEPNWLLRRVLQGYLAVGEAVDRVITDADADWQAIALGGGLASQQAVSAPTQAAISVVRAGAPPHHRPRRAQRLPRRRLRVRVRRRLSRGAAGDVRLTSIYSRGDGVVRWQSCLSDDARCVEVTGSHVGLIFNRKVYRAIADELARST